MSWRGVSLSPFNEIMRRWEGEEQALLFDPRTGDTHLLSSLAGLLLEILAARTMSFEELLACVEAELEPSPDLEMSELLHDHLHRLTRLELLLEYPA